MNGWFAPGNFRKVADDSFRLLCRARGALFALIVLPNTLFELAWTYFEADVDIGRTLIAFVLDLVMSLILAVLFVAIACQVVTQERASIKASIVWARRVRYRSYIAASILAVAAILLGFLAFIGPGIYALVIFGFVGPVALVEQTTPLATMDRSIELVRGAFWRTAGALIGLGVGASVTVEFAIAYFESGSSQPVHLVDSLVAAMARSSAASIMLAVVFILYIQRRAERDGLDDNGLWQAYHAAAARAPIADVLHIAGQTKCCPPVTKTSVPVT